MYNFSLKKSADDHRTFGERLSDGVAKFCGSWAFIIMAIMIAGCWITLNTLVAFHMLSWDVYPFILLNLVLSFIAAFQAPLIMMSQRRVEQKQDHVYRQFFAEIKSLIEVNIEIERVLVESSKEHVFQLTSTREQHAAQLKAIRKLITTIKEEKN